MQFKFKILFFIIENYLSLLLFAKDFIFQAGHPSLQNWLLPDISKTLNEPTQQALAVVGKK